MKVILISGHSGSGKDTFAQFIREEFKDKNGITIHFGDPVKWIAKQFFNWDGDKNKVEGRNLLQYIGTTLMRNYDPDYWAKIIAEFLAACAAENKYDYALIPDARFPNEIEVLQDYFPDTITVVVERYNSDRSLYQNPYFSTTQLQHESETSLDYYAFNYIIENTGSLDSLRDSAQAFVEDITQNND